MLSTPLEELYDKGNKGYVPCNKPLYSQDCSTSPSTSDVHNFPSATMNYDEIMDYFEDEFELNPLEVTALMGDTVKIRKIL